MLMLAPLAIQFILITMWEQSEYLGNCHSAVCCLGAKSEHPSNLILKSHERLVEKFALINILKGLLRMFNNDRPYVPYIVQLRFYKPCICPPVNQPNGPSTCLFICPSADVT